MHSTTIDRDGFELRAVRCPGCKDVIIHPADMQALDHFKDLKGRTFQVKLRIVGNSHAISIPKEIVTFMHEHQRALGNVSQDIDEMVRLCFEDFDRLSVRFGGEHHG
jgi:hypothetical protein